MILLKEGFDFSVIPQIQKDLSSIWGFPVVVSEKNYHWSFGSKNFDNYKGFSLFLYGEYKGDKVLEYLIVTVHKGEYAGGRNISVHCYMSWSPWQEKDLHSRWEGDNYAKWSDALKDIKSYIALVKNPKFVKIPREAILWVDPSFTPKSAPDSKWRYAY